MINTINNTIAPDTCTGSNHSIRQLRGKSKGQAIVAFLLALALLFVMFISAFEIAMYGNMDWYRRTYERHDIFSELDMEMEDVMYVTKEMMAYLRGNREDLFVTTTVGGQEVSFFGEQERFHMWEVMLLFIGGLRLRMLAIGFIIIAFVILIGTKAKLTRLLPRAFLFALGTVMAFCLFLVMAFLIDFNHAFLIFHEIFFDNDYWLFDPATSYMIRMLPEGLFYDMIMRVLAIYGIFLLVTCGASILAICKTKRRSSCPTLEEST